MAVGEGKADGCFNDASERVFGNIGSEISTSVKACASAQIPNCPNHCKTGRINRAGLRYNKDNSTSQRWICTCCKERFSDKPLKSPQGLDSSCQICAKGAKNLHVPKAKCYGTGKLPDETLAMITVFEGWLQKEGYAENCYPSDIKTLAYLGADLMNPEDVKTKIGAHKVRDGTKMLLTYAYEAFLMMNKMTWERPTYKQEEIIPFIPEEGELDQLIAAAHSKRMAAYLQTLKETYTDPGEALRIDRKDAAGRLITIRHPVKDHRPRTLEVSEKLIAMLNMIPNDSERFFNCEYSTMCGAFITLKRRVAKTTQNDRFNYIELRSYRHWGGTMIAELSNGNPISVMKMLGLRNVDNAMKYVNIWKLSFKTETNYEFLAVTTPEELKAALLGGYQFVIEKFGASWFRRPKRIAFAGTPISQRPDELQCPAVETPINKLETLNHKGL